MVDVTEAAENLPPASAQGLVDATVIVQMAERDPLYVASQYAKMQEAVKGAYGLVAVLVDRLGGAVTVKRAELDALDGAVVNIVAEGDTFRVSHGNRAQRRKRT